MKAITVIDVVAYASAVCTFIYWGDGVWWHNLVGVSLIALSGITAQLRGMSQYEINQ